MKDRVLRLLADVLTIDADTLLVAIPGALPTIDDLVNAGLVRRVGVTLSLVRP